MTSPVKLQGVKEKNMAPLVMVLLCNIHMIPACYWPEMEDNGYKKLSIFIKNHLASVESSLFYSILSLKALIPHLFTVT